MEINEKNKIALVIESPFQLLCAYEAINYFKLSKYTLYYRKTGKVLNDTQIENIIRVLELKNTKCINIPVDNVIKKLIKSLFFYLKLTTFNGYILGRYTSEFMKPIRKIFENDKIIYLDDGLETVEIQNVLYKRNIVINMFSAFKYKILDEKAFFFNDFSFLRQNFNKAYKNEIIFVGSLNVEVGKQKEEDYINIIESIIEENNINQLVYYPHRTEDKEKLKRISNLSDLKMVSPDYTIEFYLLLNQIEPRHIYSYYSTVIGSLNILFPEVAITLLEPNHLNLKPMLDKVTKTSSDKNRINMVLNYLRNIENVNSLKV